jgi:hypothetical protein
LKPASAFSWIIAGAWSSPAISRTVRQELCR